MVNTSTLHLLRKRFSEVTENLKFFSSFALLLSVTVSLYASKPVNIEGSHLLSLNELRKKKVYYSLESALQNPDKVYKLSLYHNAMLALPSIIEKFDNLQVLDVSRNRLSELPEEISQLENLQYLNVEDNQLTELPESIKNLKNLRVLNVRRNDLTKLPKVIGELSNLETLTVEYNALASLPDEISKLKNLKTLNVKNNKLSDLNSAIGSLAQLEELDLKYNEINTLPKSISNLQNLEKLGLNLHKLTIREINKFGQMLVGTNTQLGRHYLQSHDELNTGKFAQLEIHVSSTQKVEGKDATFRSTFEYNHLVKQNNSGKGVVVWEKQDDEPVVIRSEMKEDENGDKDLTSSSFPSTSE